MVLVQKWPWFQLFFSGKIGQENVFTIFYIEKTPLQPIKTRSSKSRKIDIFPKMSFTIFYIEKTPLQPIKNRSSKSRKIDIFPKMSFTIFYIKKTPLQPIKTNSSKSRKTDIFQKGLTHSFSTKLTIFPFFFQAIQARKMSFTTFQNEKTPFQPIKTRRSKSRKNKIFAKGLTHSFGLKMAVFPAFILKAIQVRKISFTIFQKKKCLSRL